MHLLEFFLQYLVIRRARMGLPSILKPLKRAKRVAGAKSFFVVYPEASHLDLHWKVATPSAVRSYYLRNCCVAIGNRSLPNVRRRLPVILRNYSSLGQMISAILYHRRDRLHPLSEQAIRHVLAVPTAINSSREEWVLSSIVRVSHCFSNYISLRNL